MTGHNLRRRNSLRGSAAAVLVVTLLLAGQACQEKRSGADGQATSAARPQRSAEAQRLAESRAAFLAAYPVFMHPRCLNCHPNGDAPLQGDDSHVHTQNVLRGRDGKGLYALKCADCHQDHNLPGAHMPPGNPNWHLTPADIPMVFQGRTPAQLARQIQDPQENGGKTLEQIVDHVTNDGLVLWGWSPGDGRTTPPLSHAEFAAKMKEWVAKGAAIPE